TLSLRHTEVQRLGEVVFGIHKCSDRREGLPDKVDRAITGTVIDHNEIKLTSRIREVLEGCEAALEVAKSIIVHNDQRAYGSFHLDNAAHLDADRYGSARLDDLQPVLDHFTSFVLEPVDLLIHHVKEHAVPSRLAPF